MTQHRPGEGWTKRIYMSRAIRASPYQEQELGREDITRVMASFPARDIQHRLFPHPILDSKGRILACLETARLGVRVSCGGASTEQENTWISPRHVDKRRGERGEGRGGKRTHRQPGFVLR